MDVQVHLQTIPKLSMKYSIKLITFRKYKIFEFS